MTTTVAELSVKVSADLASLRSGFKQLNKDLDDFDKGTKATVKKVNTYFSTIQPRINTNKANADLRSFQFYADKTAKNIQKSLQITPTINTKNLKSSSAAISKYAQSGSVFNTPNVIKTALTYFSAREVQQYADSWTSAGNKIAAAAEISGRAGRSLSEINKIATETRTDLSGTVDLYARLLRSTKDVANSEMEVAQATATVNKAFKTGGADVQEQRAGLIQLSQALGSGMLQGDELRSIRENAPVLAQAIADYFGTTIAGLKKLGSEGQLTSDKVFKAILASQSKIDAAYRSTNQTIGESFTIVSNALTEYIGKTNEATSIGARLVEGLKALANNFEAVADTTLKVASVIAAALIGRAIGGMIVKLGLATAELFKFMAALRAAQGVAGMATAFGGLGAAAGPLGALIGTVLVGALIAFGTSSDDASTHSKAYEKALKAVKAQAEGTAESIRDVTAAQREQQELDFAKGLRKATKNLEEANKLLGDQFQKLIAQFKQTGNQSLFGRGDKPNQAQITALEEINQKLLNGKMNADQAKEALAKMALADGRLEPFIKNLTEALDILLDMKAVAQRINLDKLEIQEKRFAATRDQAYTPEELNTNKKNDFFTAQFDIADNSKFEKLVDKEIKRLQEALKNNANPPSNVSDAEIRAAAEKNVTASLQTKSTDTAIEKYVNNVIGAESGGKANAKNPLSSATGVGQFIETTWLDLFKEMFPEEAKSKTRKEILDLRNDIEISKVLIAQYGKENAEALQRAGVTVNEAALQLAHFLGPQGAIKVLSAAPGTPIKGLLSDSAINANQSILGGNATVDTVKGYAEKRAGMNTPNAQMFGAKEEFGFTLEGWQQSVKNREEAIAAQTKLNPLISDYGRLQAEQQAAEEALTYAREHGLEAGKEVHDIQMLLNGDLSTLTPAAREQALAMRAYAESMGNVEVAGNKLSKAQEKIKSDFEDIRSTSRDVMQGFVQDLIDGESAATALSNALTKIADKLMDKAFDLLFNSTEEGGSGIFDTIFKALGFASGGYTGDGGKYQPAGVVHKGEYVLNQSATKKIGVGNLDRLNKGYANGGYVTGVSVPNAKMSTGSISGGGSRQKLDISLNTNDSAIAGIADARIKNATPSIASLAVSVSQKQTRANFGEYASDYQTRRG